MLLCENGANTQTHLHTLRTNMRATHTLYTTVCVRCCCVNSRTDWISCMVQNKTDFPIDLNVRELDFITMNKKFPTVEIQIAHWAIMFYFHFVFLNLIFYFVNDPFEFWCINLKLNLHRYEQRCVNGFWFDPLKFL